MSRLQRAVEILEVLNEYFQEHDGQTVLHNDAQILDGDITIKDAIAECLGLSSETSSIKIIPHSQRYRIAQYLNNWSGWQGKRKLHNFNNEEEARAWLKASEESY
jgi:hypothetical protein